MKTGFKLHLFLGILAALFLNLLIYVTASQPPLLLLAASLTFVLGSILPDIDAPFSFIRRAFSGLLFLSLLLALLAVIFIYYPYLSALLVQYVSLGTIAHIALLILLALFISAGAVLFMNIIMPFHRGVIHGFIASFLYAASLAFLAYLFSLPLYQGLFIAVAGMLGYQLHIIVDIFGSILPGRR
ncbi:hypothetical protein DRN67_03860 [Candidatus Micrarchaeota archaeon]|nr:MAG: hypothetical protein DRN67_03860 [Candidatus Micrarchaeota archaeon]